MRHSCPYIRGEIILTRHSLPPRPIVAAEPIDQLGELQQVRHAEQRPTPAQNDLGIRRYNIRPLRPNCVDHSIVAQQQQRLPIAVVTLPCAGELLPAERMKGMRYAHKTCGCNRSLCILSCGTSGSKLEFSNYHA
jgi:hypothetical protein